MTIFHSQSETNEGSWPVKGKGCRCKNRNRKKERERIRIGYSTEMKEEMENDG